VYINPAGCDQASECPFIKDIITNTVDAYLPVNTIGTSNYGDLLNKYMRNDKCFHSAIFRLNFMCLLILVFEA